MRVCLRACVLPLCPLKVNTEPGSLVACASQTQTQEPDRWQHPLPTSFADHSGCHFSHWFSLKLRFHPLSLQPSELTANAQCGEGGRGLLFHFHRDAYVWMRCPFSRTSSWSLFRSSILPCPHGGGQQQLLQPRVGRNSTN